jgi:4'-phosphopantetheinyl transferase
MGELASDEVQVWQAALDEPVPPVEELAATLSPDERARAARFHFERDRRRFVACRGILRAILAPHAGVAADGVRFRYGPRGKPALETTASGRGIRFNVSHSDGIALYALTRGREVGVDVERIRPVEGADRIAERFFSVPEREALREVPFTARLDAFFTCWTRKEAYVKARGEGLGYPLDAFAVSVAPGTPARLWSAGADEQEIARWSLAALPQAEGYVAALAVEGHGWRLSSAQWPPR